MEEDHAGEAQHQEQEHEAAGVAVVAADALALPLVGPGDALAAHGIPGGAQPVLAAAPAHPGRRHFAGFGGGPAQAHGVAAGLGAAIVGQRPMAARAEETRELAVAGLELLGVARCACVEGGKAETVWDPIRGSEKRGWLGERHTHTRAQDTHRTWVGQGEA